MSGAEYSSDREELENLIENVNLIYPIGGPKKSISDKLQLLVLKLILLLWDEDNEGDIEKMDEKLKLIDDIRHELAFLRARYYKEIFIKKSGLLF